MAIITLLTDFGTRDGYVASMKGVIAGIASQARILDITHDIDPQNVAHAAYVLHQVIPWYPANTVHVAVVDPGVGTARRIVVARVRGQFVVGPDNGLLSLLHLDGLIEVVRILENRRLGLSRVSNTFHGRDLMAPAAAHLANGLPLAEVGPATDHIEVLALARSEHDADGVCRGRVIHRDAFGNLVTNLTESDIARVRLMHTAPHVYFDDRDLGLLRRAYQDVAPGEIVALLGSDGALEIAINGGSAHKELNPTPHSIITLR